jgi:hypothetical protein
MSCAHGLLQGNVVQRIGGGVQHRLQWHRRWGATPTAAAFGILQTEFPLLMSKSLYILIQ